jgi:hypothetical protein
MIVGFTTNCAIRLSLGIPISVTNKTDRHDIAEILLKVALNIINISQSIDVKQQQSINVSINQSIKQILVIWIFNLITGELRSNISRKARHYIRHRTSLSVFRRSEVHP